jgi:hypothetical protein
MAYGNRGNLNMGLWTKDPDPSGPVGGLGGWGGFGGGGPGTGGSPSRYGGIGGPQGGGSTGITSGTGGPPADNDGGNNPSPYGGTNYFGYFSNFTNPSGYNPLELLNQMGGPEFPGISDDMAKFLPDTSTLQLAYNRMGENVADTRTSFGQSLDNSRTTGSQNLLAMTNNLGLASTGTGFGAKQNRLSSTLGSQKDIYQNQMASNLTGFRTDIRGIARGYQDSMQDYKESVMGRIMKMLQGQLISADDLKLSEE